ncbi:kinase-like domain-containing protein, partial [Phaeosphaeriaceae sp. PMI808]
SNRGRTSIVYRVKEGLVLKSLRSLVPERMRTTVTTAFAIEEQLLKRLGRCPQIVRCYGFFRTGDDMKEGLLFDEVNYRDLQSYIDSNRKISKAVTYVHTRGIIYSNLSTTNVLVHQTSQNTNLLLADFRGSRYLKLDLDGEMLPNLLFYDSKSDFQSKRLDIFSLGILLYIINTSQYPFRKGPAP